MTIPPTYTITNTMLKRIADIEANKHVCQNAEVAQPVVTNLRRNSLLKSSVFSAQIEGNTLTVDDINEPTVDEEKQYQRQEIENIITALTVLQENKLPEVFDIPFLLKLHKQVMHKLVHPSQAGIFRTEPSAIFDSHGNVVYMTPPPSEIRPLIGSLLNFANGTTDVFPLILAALSHYSFEKVHPFLDGNGRVGRLLLQAILAKHNYHFNWLLSLEEELQDKKQTYYSLLDETDATYFIEYILEVIFTQSEKLKRQLTTLTHPQHEDLLLPRRKELYNIIKDHEIISFDQLHRRFLKVPARTLRYDIKKLEQQGLIQKIGTTRGAMYQVKKGK